MRSSSEQLRGETQAAGQRPARTAGPGPLGRAASWSGSCQLAGMVEHCDFYFQVTVARARAGRGAAGHGGPAGRRQAGGGRREGAVRGVTWRPWRAATPTCTPSGSPRHARQLRQHVDALSSKNYWAAFEPRPPSSWCCSCPATRSWRPPCRRTRPCSSTRSRRTWSWPRRPR